MFLGSLKRFPEEVWRMKGFYPSVTRLLTFAFLCLLAAPAYGQVSVVKSDSSLVNLSSADSAVQKLNANATSLQDSLRTRLGLSRADSIIDRANTRLEGFQSDISHKFDSLKGKANLQRFKDSLNIRGWATGMKMKVINKVSLDSIEFTSKIDSLQGLGLPFERQRTQYDSLQRKKAALIGEIKGKQQELQQKVSQRYDGWTKNIRTSLKLDSLGVKLPGSDLSKKLPVELRDPTNGIGLPNVGGIPNTNLPNAGLTELPGIPALNDKDFANLGLSNDLAKTGGNISLPSMDQLHQWDQSIPSFSGSDGQMKEYAQMLKDPSKAAEGAVSQIGAAQEVSKELAHAEQLKQQNEALQLAEKMKNPESMKGEVKKLATAEAVNHFTGQEKVLKGAMSQMSKYKKKYARIGSLSEIKKKYWLPVNSLKGKPFRDRFRVGMHAGVQRLKDTVIVDFYPNASYRISGRLEMGAGAIYRLREETKSWSLDQRNPVWGLAGFGIFKAFKSTYLRAEVDANSYSKPAADDIPSAREWRFSFLAGTQTNFKISKSFTGNVQMLFNFDRNIKDAFPEGLTTRIGAQYKFD